MMEASRITCFILLVAILIIQCTTTSENCGPNERSSPSTDCQRTCNACRDCSSCHCKPGYIRKALGEECILEIECHKMHLQWLYDAKYKDKKDMFFNC